MCMKTVKQLQFNSVTQRANSLIPGLIYQHRMAMFRKTIILSQNGKLMMNNLYTSQEQENI